MTPSYIDNIDEVIPQFVLNVFLDSDKDVSQELCIILPEMLATSSVNVLLLIDRAVIVEMWDHVSRNVVSDEDV